MRNLRRNILAVACLSGTVTLAAACRKTDTSTTTAVGVTPDTGMTTTTTTTTTTSTAAGTSELVPVDTAVVTADPVIASQRNATRRRNASQAKSAPSSSNRTGRPGYSEERPPPARAERFVPEGTILRVAFDEPISTATARIGDTVRGRVLDDVLAEDGSVVAASGSRVVGRIENVVDSGKLGRRAELRFRLTDLETRSGNVAIRTSMYERLGDSHTKHDVGYIAGGAAVGAILGQVLGKDTDSTLKGAAAGAAVGTGVAAVTGDLDFTIEPGRTVAFTLEEPLRVR